MTVIFFVVTFLLTIGNSVAFPSLSFRGKSTVASIIRVPSVQSILVADGGGVEVEKKNQSSFNVKELNVLDLCLCGAFATAFGDFAMHPVDTIKIHQQTATAASNLLMTAKSIFLAKGIMGFYPGVLPYLIGDGISGAIKFTVFEITKKLAEKRFPAQFYGIIQFICAAVAMVTASLTLVPAEIIKTRLQAGSVSIYF